MKVLKFYIYIFLLLYSGCSLKVGEASQKKNFSEFKIIDTKTENYISYNEFIKDLLQNDIVLLGEGHYIPEHIFSEKKIILDLANYKQVDVVFEMGDVSKQESWNNAMKNRKSIKNLQKALSWDEAWDYSHYGQLVEPLFYKNVNLVAGNLTKDEINTIYLGAVPIQGKLSTTKEVQDKIKKGITVLHSTNDAILDKMVQIQQYKDRRMADKLVNSKNLSVLVAGKFHTYKNVGVPLHIRDFDSSKKFKVVIFSNSVLKDYSDENYYYDSIDKKESDYFIIFNERANYIK